MFDLCECGCGGVGGSTGFKDYQETSQGSPSAERYDSRWLIRDGEPMMIKGDTQIQAYDHVVVFCLDTAMRKLEDYFN